MDFVCRFNARISLDEKFVLKKENKYFLLNRELEKIVSKDFFYAGEYLGKIRKGKFFPSLNLLRIIAEGEANKVAINQKTAWLFICGRDIFRQGIVKVVGSKKKGDYTLILNLHGECLGFGEIQQNLDSKGKGVFIRNILDIGDFLRRESAAT